MGPVYVAAQQQLENVFRTWDETGIFVEGLILQELRKGRDDTSWRQIYKEMYAVVPLPEVSLRRMIRAEARLAKRDVVLARHHYWDNSTSLTIRRLKRLAPISTHLSLVAVEQLRWRNPKPPVSVVVDNRNFYFFFNSGDGQHVFDHFLEQCRTNPDFRKALRIPEKVNDSQEVHHRAEDRRAA